MSETVPLLETRCGHCRLLIIEGIDEYSCPRNKRGIPKYISPNWATHCSIYEEGQPRTELMRRDNTEISPIYFTKHFAIRLTPDYRTVVLVAKKGFKLAIDPSQTSEKKIVVTSLEAKQP